MCVHRVVSSIAIACFSTFCVRGGPFRVSSTRPIWLWFFCEQRGRKLDKFKLGHLVVSKFYVNEHTEQTQSERVVRKMKPKNCNHFKPNIVRLHIRIHQ